MQKLLVILLIIIFLTSCGTSNQAASYSGETNTYQHNHEEHGMKLTADIEIDQDIIVDATLENVSGKTLVYNARCEIPFHISIKLDGASAHLNSNQESIACEDIFDPDDLEDFPPGESIDKSVTFTREFGLHNSENTPAHEGDYVLNFSFQTHEDGRLVSEFPFELTHDTEPEILTLQEAEEYAFKSEEFEKWHNAQKDQGLELVNEGAILSSGGWHVMFHTVGEEMVNRIVVAVNYDTGDIMDVNKSTFKEEGMEDFLDRNN